ncbi:hypothetical protein HPP92_024506 [Vanilla planifolia]|uniref:Protein EARLY FLOWERING 4 domain-containing protein n=2 Tax=Vanilla planifolia TaxID=51239 RepID=A0A835PPP4_VANPL|nr:hypothetical protein HPP92_024781 [Vanilla planifolia]KAG0456718.1 hypothetical protein HPP92_024506 [Vanilla planifolia]
MDKIRTFLNFGVALIIFGESGFDGTRKQSSSSACISPRSTLNFWRDFRDFQALLRTPIGEPKEVQQAKEGRRMEGETFSSLGNGTQMENKVVQNFQKSFVQVQNILDQNRLLINEINQNHESKIPDNLTRNVGLIRELNNNIRRVVDLYADLSSSFAKSMESSSDGDSSAGTLRSDAKKRIRSS